MGHTFLERILYAVKRHAVAIVAVVAGLLALFILANPVWLEDHAHLLVGGILRVGAGTILILMITKFGFPKLNIQSQIQHDPVAVAIFAGLVAVAIALLF